MRIVCKANVSPAEKCKHPIAIQPQTKVEVRNTLNAEFRPSLPLSFKEFNGFKLFPFPFALLLETFCTLSYVPGQEFAHCHR